MIYEPVLFQNLIRGNSWQTRIKRIRRIKRKRTRKRRRDEVNR
jgi:hypothetical protein